ncbi:MAG TPA: ROK family protein, partial [Methylomirabilota bacterium]|nr:ROK family protein [Methylomirabilota bacterium]
QEGRERGQGRGHHRRRAQGRGEEGVGSVVGVDVGGTSIRAGAVTADGRFSQVEHPTEPRRGPDAVLASVEEAIRELAVASGEPVAIGVACAGMIRPDGLVVRAPNLGWRDVPLGEHLGKAFGVPVTVENDVRAAAWGEYRFALGTSVHSLVAVFVGTGVGSGAVLDGALWRGADNGAGELGHTRVVLDGLPCPCGGRGCLEQYVSGAGFQRRLGAALAEGASTVLARACAGDPDALTATMVAAAANNGDELARALWMDARGYLALGLANYVTLLNPQVLVLGGGVIAALPELFDAVAGAVMASTTVLARESLRIQRARLGDWAGVLGAVALAAPVR